MEYFLIYFNERGETRMPDCRLVLRTAGGKESIHKRNPAAPKESFLLRPKEKGRRDRTAKLFPRLL